MADMAAKAETPKKEKKRWSKSITKDKKTHTLEVKEAENGFIITESKEWYDKEDNWKHERKEYISEDNPLNGEDDDEDNFSFQNLEY